MSLTTDVLHVLNIKSRWCKLNQMIVIPVT